MRALGAGEGGAADGVVQVVAFAGVDAVDAAHGFARRYVRGGGKFVFTQHERGALFGDADAVGGHAACDGVDDDDLAGAVVLGDDVVTEGEARGRFAQGSGHGYGNTHAATAAKPW